MVRDTLLFVIHLTTLSVPEIRPVCCRMTGVNNEL
jgi:hypothetical protein